MAWMNQLSLARPLESEFTHIREINMGSDHLRPRKQKPKGSPFSCTPRGTAAAALRHEHRGKASIVRRKGEASFGMIYEPSKGGIAPRHLVVGHDERIQMMFIEQLVDSGGAANSLDYRIRPSSKTVS
jgi:hypothetical protein